MQELRASHLQKINKARHVKRCKQVVIQEEKILTRQGIIEDRAKIVMERGYEDAVLMNKL